MPIDVYGIKFSSPCRAVYMTAKHLNIDLNEKVIDLSEGQHLTEDYLKINPGHLIPAINDDGFILCESRAIMQYLCNRYAPDSSLYPKEPKERALVDRWLYFDMTLFGWLKIAYRRALVLGVQTPEEEEKKLIEGLKHLDSLIGHNKYLVGNHLTIADLSVLATTSGCLQLDTDLTLYPNLNTWYNRLESELTYFKAINFLDRKECLAFVAKRIALKNFN